MYYNGIWVKNKYEVFKGTGNLVQLPKTDGIQGFQSGKQKKKQETSA